MILYMFLKFNILFSIIFFIFIFCELPVQSEDSWDISSATNLIDEELQLPALSQNLSVSSQADKLKGKAVKSVWNSATRRIKRVVHLRRKRELLVGPASSQPFNRPLTVFLTTFNAGGCNPPTNCLSSPGGPPSNDSLCYWLDFKGQQPDLVVVGLQEMTSLTIQNYFTSTVKKTNKQQDRWLSAINSVLNRADRQYRRLTQVRLLGLFLVVYHRPDMPISEVHKATVNTGFMGRVGNKGGVGISMQIGDDLTICFLNSHLTAGEHKEDLENRNMDAARVARKMRFRGKTLNEHDVVFWMGDFNYRLSELSTSREQVIAKCKDNDFKGLLKYDELLKQRKAGIGALAEYQEADINFRPTYKFEPGTGVWDESEKMRMPAWCDRIMFKVYFDKWKTEFVESSYESVENVLTSDHKPVRAMLVVKKG